MKKLALKSGQQFQWWTLTGVTMGGRWECRCRCGNVRHVKANSLLSGKSGSCGCRAKIAMRKIGEKKLQHNIPGYRSWRGMIERCHDSKNSKFHLYGGRGITVCERWRESFWNFYEDMGTRLSLAHSIDRINTNGPYSPENCRWADIFTQNRNKRTNRPVFINGVVKTIPEWSEVSGVPIETMFESEKISIVGGRHEWRVCLHDKGRDSGVEQVTYEPVWVG